VSSVTTDSTTVKCKKKTAGTIALGKTVFIDGYDAGDSTILVELSDADQPALLPALGISAQSFTNSASGDVRVSGELSGIDTSSFAVGDNLYVSKTPGELISTLPTGATTKIQKIATVLKVDASGIVYVGGALRSNALPNVAENKFWVGNASGNPVEVLLRSDATPAALGTADTGTSALLSRGDHVHGHGDLTGVTFHAVATDSLNGFMSAADKTALDALNSGCIWAQADYNGNDGDRRSLSIPSTGSARFNFYVPILAAAITKAVLVAKPTSASAGSGKNIDLSSKFGNVAAGESIDQHGEVDTTTVFDFTGLTDKFVEIDITPVLSVLAAGDQGGVLVSQVSVGGVIHYYGLLIEYTL
jgi:hypothetical protein